MDLPINHHDFRTVFDNRKGAANLSRGISWHLFFGRSITGSITRNLCIVTGMDQDDQNDQNDQDDVQWCDPKKEFRG